MATYVMHSGPTWAISTVYAAGAIVDNEETTNRAYECITGGTSGGTAADEPTHETEQTEGDGLRWKYIDTVTHTNMITLEGAIDDPVGDTDSYTVKFIKETNTSGVRQEINTAGVTWQMASTAASDATNHIAYMGGHEYFDDGAGAPAQRGHDMDGGMVSCDGFVLSKHNYTTIADMRIVLTGDDGIRTDIWDPNTNVTLDRLWCIGDGGANEDGIWCQGGSNDVTIQRCVIYGTEAGIHVRDGSTYNVYHCTVDQCATIAGSAGFSEGNRPSTSACKNSVAIRAVHASGLDYSANWDTYADCFDEDTTGTDTITDSPVESVFTDADGRDYSVVASSDIDGACAAKITGIDYDFAGNAFNTPPSAGAFEVVAAAGGGNPYYAYAQQ